MSKNTDHLVNGQAGYEDSILNDQEIEPTPEDLDTYRQNIRKLAECQDAFVFDNTNSAHAAIVMSAIFDHSQSVKVYTRGMQGKIGNRPDYYQSLEKFLKSGKQLQIILDREDSLKENHPTSIKIILQHNEKNPSNPVHVRKSNDAFLSSIKKVSQANIAHHFSVADKQMFRLQLNSKHQAIGSFNDVKTASVLTEIFDNHFNGLKKIL